MKGKTLLNSLLFEQKQEQEMDQPSRGFLAADLALSLGLSAPLY